MYCVGMVVYCVEDVIDEAPRTPFAPIICSIHQSTLANVMMVFSLCTMSATIYT